MRKIKSPNTWFNSHQCDLWRWLLIGCLFSFVSGCASLTPQTSTESISTVYLQPSAPASAKPAADFNILGRISIQDRDQSSSGTFRWQHLASNDEILLFTPLGQTIAEITNSPEGVRLITSKLEAFYAKDVESLTEEILGWRLPLSGLQYWIQGVHSPLSGAEKDVNTAGQTVAIRQDGWKILYTHYTSAQSDQPPRPRVLELVYADLRIRLAIDNWNVE
ncbi:outer membrane lipoprotein LolB [Nitrosomonas sp. JL21]|uniref:lipoprotein insertase outer membrane protein LolB n=1 Tax=Nitrosomonas sp. JL21 TaxID=153949 RepID=UPI00136F7525|nr:lipoprotein insertase outer membrane protein LolB [Nitrosomonas sp. JL21]MBL8496600.1 outer membrane lipoprotein LolB [Nitrosomonas sp.]MCC7090919.1 outer membrane lipoprotein LolB [Nitrosomonas sp.]MXS76486.1 outer membrane lipoprotein LolB [Nitrosomonas sp. JL21]